MKIAYTNKIIKYDASEHLGFIYFNIICLVTISLQTPCVTMNKVAFIKFLVQVPEVSV